MERIERKLGLASVLAVSISAMLGAGIFVLPGLAFAKTGPSVWLAYIAAGICVVPAALSKAELATAVSTSGGSFVYLDRAFGPLAGTIAGLALWLAVVLKTALALAGVSLYLLLVTELPFEATSLALLGAMGWLNMRGIRRVGRLQVLIVVVSLLGLAALSVGAGISMRQLPLEHLWPTGSIGFVGAVGFVFVSFVGVTQIDSIAQEVRRPERNLPLGMLLSLLIVTAVYGGVAFVLAGSIRPSMLAGDASPIYTLAESLGDTQLLLVGVAMLGVVAMGSMTNAGLRTSSRYPFAMSRDDLLPPSLRALHKRFVTPVRSIALSVVFIAVVTLLIDLERIATFASALMLMIFVAVNVAVIVLRETRVQWYKPSFRAPLYPWLQGFGVLTGGGLLFVMGSDALWALLVVVVPGAVLYLAYGQRRTERKGVIGQRGPRRELLTTGEFDLREVGERKVAVVVALFGTERSPEMLVEVGHALSEGGDIEVIHLTELPEQVGLDAVTGEDRSVTSVKRRILAMAEAQDLPLRFVSQSSRDIVQTVHDMTRRLDCRWLVMEWRMRSAGTLTIANPLGWLAGHLSCNLATFYDHGVRYIRKILIHVEPGPHDALVLGTADTLAKAADGDLTFARLIGSAADAETRQSAADYLDQVRDVTTVKSEALLMESDAPYDTLANESVGYDLLITPAQGRSGIINRLRRSRVDRVVERASCSVLRLQAPASTSHEAFERFRSSATIERSFMDFVHPACAARLKHGKKDVLFDKFAEIFAGALSSDLGISKETIASALWERERTQNTALGNGIALPHATIAAAGRTYLGVFTTHEAIDYQAHDGQDVDVFFVTLGTPGDRNEHLVLLGSIARLVKSTDLLERLRTADWADEILAALRDCSVELGL